MFGNPGCPIGGGGMCPALELEKRLATFKWIETRKTYDGGGGGTNGGII